MYISRFKDISCMSIYLNSQSHINLDHIATNFEERVFCSDCERIFCSDCDVVMSLDLVCDFCTLCKFWVPNIAFLLSYLG